jgi:peptidoglycan/LPS O-acetylase OafA/YrhL
MDTASLLWSLLFGTLGLGYLTYGRRQRKPSAFLSGALLCTYPFFIDNTWLLVGIGAALLALPFLTEY